MGGVIIAPPPPPIKTELGKPWGPRWIPVDPLGSLGTPGVPWSIMYIHGGSHGISHTHTLKSYDWITHAPYAKGIPCDPSCTSVKSAMGSPGLRPLIGTPFRLCLRPHHPPHEATGVKKTRRDLGKFPRWILTTHLHTYMYGIPSTCCSVPGGLSAHCAVRCTMCRR